MDRKIDLKFLISPVRIRNSVFQTSLIGALLPILSSDSTSQDKLIAANEPDIDTSSPAVSQNNPGRIAAQGFRSPTIFESLWQVITSFGGFLGVCAAMYLTIGISFWIAAPLALVAAGFLVRIFIIQHDCGHGSFFKSQRANHALGMVCGIITLAPYSSWRRQHAGHHGIWNNLDRRYSGADIYSSCLTVAEYRALSPWKRHWYRVMRHPLIANVLLPPLVFILLFRLPFDTPKGWWRERYGVYATDASLVVAIVGLGLLLGFGHVAVVHLSIMVPASIIGVWLFSVQHRFEQTHWKRNAKWQFDDAALLGSSYLRLPRILQWFTGNIGFHHIHHLDPHIPNYRLQACHESNPILRTGPSFTLRSGLGQWRYALWDEACERMVSFKSAGRKAPAVPSST